jgi:hypothetical protein
VYEHVVSIAVRRSACPARVAASASRVILTRPLEQEAELWIGSIADDAILLGAYGRGADVPPADMPGGLLFRRGSGGPPVRVGPGTLHVVLALREASSLVACDPPRIVNRYVRPLLRALTRSSAMAHYFGRDWIAVKHRPAAWVGFAHDATTQRAALEAFIAVRTPFAVGARESFLGKEAGTVESLAGVAIDESALGDAIVTAYASAYGRAAIDAGSFPDVTDDDDDPRRDPPWSATAPEAIGVVGAGLDQRGRFRVGGDLMVSDDALKRLENELQTRSREESPEDIARIVDASLGASGVVVDGVRSLASIRDVILRARVTART